MEINSRFDNPPKTKIKAQMSDRPKVNFGEGSVMTSTMDAVARGGLVASFCVQDGLGCILPRFSTGLTRNRKDTGEWNIKFAMEEFLREVLTGPCMFAVPAIMLGISKKYFGTANDVPINQIKSLGSIFKDNAESYTNLATKESKKRAFYVDTFKNILEASADKKDLALAEEFADALIKTENAKSKSFWKKFRGTKVEGSAQDLLDSLSARFIELRKNASVNVTENLSAVKFVGVEDGGAPSFKSFTNHLKNYSNDIIDSLEKNAGKNITEFAENFNLRRIASRSILNLAMTAGVFAFISIIPKIYKVNKTYPGTIGHDKKDENAEEAPKNVSFKGRLDDLGRKIIGKTKLKNFIGNCEYDGISMSFPTLVAVCAAVPIPRLATSRDENDFWDTIFRDLPTIGAILFGVKAIRNTFADMFTKATGFALAHKPQSGTNFLKKVFSNRAFSTEYIVAKYSNIRNYKNGIVDFAEFIKAQGGDMNKLMNFDGDVKKAFESIHSKHGEGKSLSAMGNDDIIAMFKKAVASGEDKLQDIYKAFDGADNVFVKKAKNLGSRFDFAATFLLVPLCLGILIPKMNEYLSKKRTMKKMDAEIKSETIQQQYKMNIDPTFKKFVTQ